MTGRPAKAEQPGQRQRQPRARDRLAAVVSPELFALVEQYVREVALEVTQAEIARAAFRRPSWYSVEEAARRLGISPAAVRMRATRGRLETRRQGRRLYVAAASVDELEPAGGRC